MESSSLEVRKQQELETAFLEADNIIMKKYMSDISKYEVKNVESELEKEDLNSVFRLNKVEKLVYNADENNLEKLMNVYNAVGLCGGSIVNIVIGDGDKTDYYIGTRAADVNKVATCQDVLVSSMEGNFQGSTVKLQKKGGLQECVNNVFGEESKKSITVVSGIPKYRNKENKENKKYIQGIEKVIDAMNGKKFAFITISTPLSNYEIEQIKDSYENLYTQISPFAGTQLSYNESDSNAVAQTITDGLTKTMGESLAKTISKSTTNSQGWNSSKNIGGSLIVANVSNSRGTNHSTSMQQGLSTNESKNYSNADSHSVGKTDTYTNTSGRSLQISMENKAVKNLMERIESMLKRIEDSKDLGLWNTATYCIADNVQTSKVLASAIEAICRGDKGSVESFAVETWDEERKRKQIEKYLKKMKHPIIEVKGENNVFEVYPSSLVNGKELVIEAGLPQKSLPGMPISEMVEFSRNVVCENSNQDRILKLGHIYHMGAKEKTEVNLDIESLSAHTLITGSTGSGKSNTVYHILNKLRDNGVKFLVVEPAKGEYKNVFGNDKDVTVYSTNDRFSKLLKINPFKFPKSVHVLEHIDRLIEIFNVCWPMYAAMPAVLKESVLNAYENCGWDLEESECEYGDEVFPTFKDIQKELVEVINESSYSDEVKGNYIGSLATRIKSLTNGINGKIFSDNDIAYTDLFDNNVIVDLSRVGSAETKSLIMGLIVMALNEYRMDQALGSMNQNLKHMTVLEEAHNLLRNTSSMTSSSEDGGDLAGKSVEMITNSIAEMRTYGEGFIIVDQSPSAIDISAIRNTNTKIIMRLPEETDRKQAGKSAALKDKQIDELAKLNRGIAVVYQNNWLDPVLCMIEKANVEEKPYYYKKEEANKAKKNSIEVLKMLMKDRVDEKIDYDIDSVEKYIKESNLSTKTKIDLYHTAKAIKNNDKPILLEETSFKNLSNIVVEILGVEDRLNKFVEIGDNCELLQQELNREIERNAFNASKELKLAISQCILREIVEKDNENVELYSKWREFAVENRKLV